MESLKHKRALQRVLGPALACAMGVGACTTGTVGGGLQASSGAGANSATSASGATNGAVGPGGTVGTAGGSSASADGGLSTPDCVSGAPNPGLSPLRRLSLEEYATTVNDLLGVDTSSVLSTFPPDQLLATEGAGFSNNADALEVSALLANAYMTAAETFATAAVANLPALVGCSRRAN